MERQENDFRWKLEFQEENLLIQADMAGVYDSDQLFVTLRESPETRTFYLDLNRSGSFFPNAAGSHFHIDTRPDGWTVLLAV